MYCSILQPWTMLKKGILAMTSLSSHPLEFISFPPLKLEQVTVCLAQFHLNCLSIPTTSENLLIGWERKFPYFDLQLSICASWQPKEECSMQFRLPLLCFNKWREIISIDHQSILWTRISNQNISIYIKHAPFATKNIAQPIGWVCSTKQGPLPNLNSVFLMNPHEAQPIGFRWWKTK